MCRKVDEAADFLRAVGAIRKPYMQMGNNLAEPVPETKKLSHSRFRENARRRGITKNYFFRSCSAVFPPPG